MGELYGNQINQSAATEIIDAYRMTLLKLGGDKPEFAVRIIHARLRVCSPYEILGFSHLLKRPFLRRVVAELMLPLLLIVDAFFERGEREVQSVFDSQDVELQGVYRELVHWIEGKLDGFLHQLLGSLRIAGRKNYSLLLTIAFSEIEGNQIP